ncbi:MAG: lipopolysaccharide heptosyltransferase family protein [Ignavibacteriales bacterium]|nr:lipopolysaccharide heptosyltransferase family protein [Ignavibacteriales bacterium]MCF8306397.1 lipopolysaccharide heptosyltransferase family protein [Ignavibacteriales bacterium]MCF8435748.1 lipopolysaccharide heptosyltransferase family protein [Ignavibacteriales bacterium]
MIKNSNPNILICRQDRIGDNVLTTPIPRELKRNLPGCRISVLVRRYAADIYLNNPFVDNIIILDDVNITAFSGFIKKIKQIRAEEFDISLMPLPDERLNYLMWFSGIKLRISSGVKIYQLLTNTKSVHRRKYIQERHEADYCLDLIRKLNFDVVNISPEIYLSEDENISVISKKQKFKSRKKYVVGLQVSSGKSAPNWQPEIYRILLNNLNNDPEISAYITDLPGSVNGFEDKYFIDQDKGLRDSILNFAALDCLVSASTGPMHICAALKIPTVALFCPLPACKPSLWGAMGNDSEHIFPSDDFCKNECPGDPKECFFKGDRGIQVSTVLNAIKQILLRNDKKSI